MGEDHFETIPAWVQRVAVTADESAQEAVLDGLLESLRAQLGSEYPGTQFRTYRHQENLFIEWQDEPQPSLLADRLGLDTYTHGSGLKIGPLWFHQELPDTLEFAYVLFKHVG
jgi:hypothetical protein